MSLIGYYTTSYRKLVDMFGPPSDGDGYKVSTEWIVTYNDSTYTIYDYKDTDLYDEFLPSVEEFRSKCYYKWHIGGCEEPDEFIAYLNNKEYEY